MIPEFLVVLFSLAMCFSRRELPSTHFTQRVHQRPRQPQRYEGNVSRRRLWVVCGGCEDRTPVQETGDDLRSQLSECIRPLKSVRKTERNFKVTATNSLVQ